MTKGTRMENVCCRKKRIGNALDVGTFLGCILVATIPKVVKGCNFDNLVNQFFNFLTALPKLKRSVSQ